MKNIIFFFKSKYFITCLSYAILMGASISLRVCLVFLLGSIFAFGDANKFIVYSVFTVTADLAPILGTYLIQNFIRNHIACLLAFFFACIGIAIFSFSVFNKNILLFYFGMSLMSLGIGIIRSNLMAINTGYLNLEFPKDKKEYGSLLYLHVVSVSFIMIFFGGFLLNKKSEYIIIFPTISIFLSMLFFILTEKTTLKNDIKDLILSKSSFNLQKFFYFLFGIGAFLTFSLSFYYFGHIKLFFNLPIIFFISFYIYLIIRFFKNADERESIAFAIFCSILIVFFLMIERQRDTSIALFIMRNVNYKQLGLNPMQINAIFSIFMLSVNLLFFKAKIHTKINLSKLSILMPFLVFLSFLILYINCFFVDAFGRVSLYPYIFTMIFMSVCSVLVFAKYSEVCSFANQKIRVIISSFMVSSMGFGFYLTRFLGSFMEVDKNNSDPFYSLEIYKNGFFKIIIITVIFSLFNLFFINAPKIKKIF